jgi:AraC-like DNA-binding protein
MIENFKNFTSFMNPDDPISVRLVGETYCDKSFKISRDCSDMTALEYIIDGTGTLKIEGQHLTPSKGDIFFLKEGTKHKYSADETNPWHKYWIVFQGPFADAMIENYMPKDTYHFKNCAVKSYFEEIYKISINNYPYDVMVNKITVQLLKIFMYLRNMSRFDVEDLAEVIKKYLDESIEDDFNLDKLCSEVNYSKNYVINVFKEKYGITPYKYFIDRKIEVSKSYLTHTNVSIGDIAKLLHYADQQYFSTVFRNATGISPLKFRRITRK